MENLKTHIIASKNGMGEIICYEAIYDSLNIIKFAEDNKSKLENELLRYGGILLRGFNIRSLSEFNKLSKTIVPNLLDYENRSTPRTKLGGKIYTSTEYPPSKRIPFHNENSYTLKWPSKILFFSVIVAEEGGETAIADSRCVHDNIDKDIVDEFNNKKVLYVRNYMQGIDLSWQEVFQTEVREEVENYCRENKIDYKWGNGNIELTTKQVCQATIKHPKTKEAVWFNQAHLFNKSYLKQEELDKLEQLFGKEKFPRNSYYGDGSEIPQSYFDIISASYEKEKIEFKWQKGDVMLLDNVLMAHSRNPFKGNRKVVVAMGN